MTEILDDGDCFKEFLGLINHWHGQRSAEQIRKCAVQLVRSSVQMYEKKFGPGDVGHRGTGKVSRRFVPTETEPVPLETNGLLYGRVQSGKTHASIATVAMASENGFRC